MAHFELPLPLLPLHLARRSLHEPVYEHFACFRKRLFTFRHYHWPTQIRQTPYDLAKAGFVYTGHTDAVLCFNCGTGLQEWQTTDDPYAEHAKQNPNCVYLRSMRPLEFINQAQTVVTLPIQSLSYSDIPEEDVTNLQPLDTLQECVVCLTRARSIAFKPCGHLATCVDCSFQVQKCAICRTVIVERLRIYTS